MVNRTTMKQGTKLRILTGFEKLLLLFGLLLLLIYIATRLYGTWSSHSELRRFWDAKKTSEASNSSQARADEPDFRLWSQQRIAAYKASLDGDVPIPLAVLSIPAINLEAPLLPGTDELTLNRGVGHIDGTAAPGTDGNIGIAGHRDGFFRGLKDVHEGDVIDLSTPDRTSRYRVDETLIVSPEDVHVLQRRAKPSITLVTCYPFYFIGSAPQRYIIHASIVSTSARQEGRSDRIEGKEERAKQKASLVGDSK